MMKGIDMFGRKIVGMAIGTTELVDMDSEWVVAHCIDAVAKRADCRPIAAAMRIDSALVAFAVLEMVGDLATQ